MLLRRYSAAQGMPPSSNGHSRQLPPLIYKAFPRDLFFTLFISNLIRQNPSAPPPPIPLLSPRVHATPPTSTRPAPPGMAPRAPLRVLLLLSLLSAYIAAKPSPSAQPECTWKPDPGSCRGFFRRYYYNTVTRVSYPASMRTTLHPL